jgi:hypothetical protein
MMRTKHADEKMDGIDLFEHDKDDLSQYKSITFFLFGDMFSFVSNDSAQSQLNSSLSKLLLGVVSCSVL